MDFGKIADMAKQAGDLANNPVAQGVLNNPVAQGVLSNSAFSGIIGHVESMTNMDLDGNGSVGGKTAQDAPGEEENQAEEGSAEE